MKKLFLSLILSVSFSSLAGEKTTIKEILVGKDFSNRVFIVLEDKPSEPISCNTNSNYTYVFDGGTDLGKMYLSLALTAHSTQKEVVVDGDNTCSLYSNVETLRYIRLLN